MINSKLPCFLFSVITYMLRLLRVLFIFQVTFIDKVCLSLCFSFIRHALVVEHDYSFLI